MTFDNQFQSNLIISEVNYLNSTVSQSLNQTSKQKLNNLEVQQQKYEHKYSRIVSFVGQNVNSDALEIGTVKR